MVSINYVIAAWGGDRRGGCKDIIYFRKHIEQLQKLQHSVTQITLCISSDGKETDAFKSYVDSLVDIDLPLHIMYRENVGLSYGTYSDVYEKFRDQFDYYLFIEDDYYFVEDNFDKTLINIFNKTPNCGYVCGYVSQAQGKRWMGNSNGLTSSKVLETIRNKYGKLPYDETCVGKKYTEESGQVTFSDSFVGAGFTLTDITEKYEILHYYWQHTKVKPIPAQKSLGSNKYLFLPFEVSQTVQTSPFNEVFIPYKDKHCNKEAIIFATGPTLSAYDYLEDDGDRIRVGVNSIALKPIALDYYFCGHVDDRSKPYLDDIKNYKVGIEKFGYIALDGISSSKWLSLTVAKELGLKPYGLTTHVNFNTDISKECLVNHLIIFSALQFLIYAGVTKIYLVGADTTQLVSCDNYSIDTDRNVDRMATIFQQFASFAKGKTEIVSINPVGLKGIFSDVYRCDITPFMPPEKERIMPTKKGGSKPTNYTSIQNQSILDAMNNGGYTS